MSHDSNITAILELLAERWPAAFSIYEGRRKPLKLKIHFDVLAALDGAVTPVELKRALRIYTANRVYRSRCIAGATRIDLAGKPAGTVTEQQEATKPTMACAAKTPSETPAPPAPPAETTPSAAPKRLSLADLREAARRRKEAASAA